MAFNFLFAEHGSPARLCATTARRILARFGIVDVVVVGEFLAGGDVAKSNDPDVIVNLVGFAVRLAGVIHERRHAKAIDHRLAVVHAIQVGYFAAGIHAGTLFGGEAGPSVLENSRASRDRRGGVDTRTVQR